MPMQDNATIITDGYNSTSVSFAGDSSTLLVTTTTTFTSVHHDFYDAPKQRYDEKGTIHLVAVVSSVIVFIGMIFTVKSIISFIRAPRGSSHNSGIRPGPSFLQWLADEPPPYPGKYSRTNVNYLPSYESALEIDRSLQWVRDATEMASANEREVDQKVLKSEITSDSGSDVVVFMVGGDLDTSQENFVNLESDRQGDSAGPPPDTYLENERGLLGGDVQGATGIISLDSENEGNTVNNPGVHSAQVQL